MLLRRILFIIITVVLTKPAFGQNQASRDLTRRHLIQLQEALQTIHELGLQGKLPQPRSDQEALVQGIIDSTIPTADHIDKASPEVVKALHIATESTSTNTIYQARDRLAHYDNLELGVEIINSSETLKKLASFSSALTRKLNDPQNKINALAINDYEWRVYVHKKLSSEMDHYNTEVLPHMLASGKLTDEAKGSAGAGNLGFIQGQLSQFASPKTQK